MRHRDRKCNVGKNISCLSGQLKYLKVTIFTSLESRVTKPILHTPTGCSKILQCSLPGQRKTEHPIHKMSRSFQSQSAIS